MERKMASQHDQERGCLIFIIIFTLKFFATLVELLEDGPLHRKHLHEKPTPKVRGAPLLLKFE